MFHCRWTGRSTSATLKPAPTRVGQGRPCPPRRSGIVPHTARRKAQNASFPGARKLPIAASAILILSVGIRRRSAPFLMGRAPSESLILSATDGSGHRPRLRPFPALSPSSSIPDIPPISSTAAHYVMKGGSARTAACMLRRSFRNWFQPHYQYVYAGFRCVRS